MNSGRTIIDLNGTWEIEPGDEEMIPAAFTHQVPVPALVDCAEPGYDWANSDYHWYRKSFFVSHEVENRPAFLKIEQSMFGTDVYLNGTFVGGSISCYTSQEYRIDNHLKYHSQNQLTVRVGKRENLPPESAVGKDMERLSFIPGIWGDVRIEFTGPARVKLAQTIPHINESTVEVNVWLEELSGNLRRYIATGIVSEKVGGSLSSAETVKEIELLPNQESEQNFISLVKNPKLWSPDSPFLYTFTVEIRDPEGKTVDTCGTNFGMREFKIDGRYFLLNGEKIFLRGSNVAFHRFLSDRDRKLLPWDREWVKKVLVDIPKAHNFNFFRAHLGHMYNRWYDVADEGGIMIQDEWQFWGTTGTKEQITREFSDWIRDNWNHPSIVIWDALNESSDEVVQEQIIPEMKRLDPTRPWESYDFREDHPYIYAIGPVLVDRKFGYTRSLKDIESSSYPSEVNEYVWWWLDKDQRPSKLTEKVLARWLGNEYTEDELVRHQTFLASELTELFRRIDVKAIQPFVYLSCNEGPTSHWFKGDIEALQPKPVLAALKNAFEPLGVSVELWDRHFFHGERRSLSIYVFNDYAARRKCRLQFGIKTENDDWLVRDRMDLDLLPSERLMTAVAIQFPKEAGDYVVVAEAEDADTGRKAVSRKIACVYPDFTAQESWEQMIITVLEPARHVGDFLESKGINVVRKWVDARQSADMLFVVGEAARGEEYTEHFESIGRWVERGGSLFIVEPEAGVGKRTALRLPDGSDLVVEPRMDKDQGGYDSYVIADDLSSRLWDGIRKIDLRMFNGGFGGEIVPEYNLSVDGEHRVLARCGLGLSRPAVVEKQVGRGFVVVSSIRVVDRLSAKTGCYENLFAPRPDPVAQRLLLNLIGYSVELTTGLNKNKLKGKGYTKSGRKP